VHATIGGLVGAVNYGVANLFVSSLRQSSLLAPLNSASAALTAGNTASAKSYLSSFVTAVRDVEHPAEPGLRRTPDQLGAGPHQPAVAQPVYAWAKRWLGGSFEVRIASGDQLRPSLPVRHTRWGASVTR
jgi:hypothetical protein